MAVTPIGELVECIQGEFLELPGLHLTEVQSGRLWDVDRTTCGAMFDALVDARPLRRVPDGSFARSETERVARTRRQ